MLLVASGLSYIFLLRSYVKSLNLVLYRFTCMSQFWVYVIITKMSGNLKKNPGRDPSSSDRFSICQWNLNGGLACNFIKLSFLPVYIYSILPAYAFCFFTSNVPNQITLSINITSNDSLCLWLKLFGLEHF